MKVFTINSTGEAHIKRIEVDSENNEVRYVCRVQKGPRQTDELVAFLAEEHLYKVFGRRAELTVNNKGSIVEVCYAVKMSDEQAVLASLDKLERSEDYKAVLSKEWFDRAKAMARMPQRPELPQINNNNSPKPAFEIGDRTIDHRAYNNFSTNVVEYKNETYQMCSGDLNFMDSAIRKFASVGGNREIILLDADSNEMQQVYQEFVNYVEERKKSPGKTNLLHWVNEFSNQKIKTYEDIEVARPKERERVLVGGNEQQQTVYSMQEIIDAEKGVCRHQALFVAFLLGEYGRHHFSQKTSIHHCRSDIEGGAHTWVVSVRDNQLCLIDPTWKKTLDLTKYEQYKMACRLYGRDVINNTLKRAHFEIPKPLINNNNNPNVNQGVRPNNNNNQPRRRALFANPNRQNNQPANQNAAVQQPQVAQNIVPQQPLVEQNIVPPQLTANENLAQELDKGDKADLGFVRDLIENQGADANTKSTKNEWRAAHVAAYQNDLSLMKFLVEKGAYLNHVDSKGKNPLHFAQTEPMVDYLIQAGVTFLRKSKISDKTALQILVDKKIINLDKHLKWELNKRFSNIQPQKVQALIASGANPNCATESNHPVGVAVGHNSSELLQCLRENGIDVNAKVNGLLPLEYALKQSMVDELISAGANVNLRNSAGQPMSEVLRQNGLNPSPDVSFVAQPQFNQPAFR